MKFPLEVLSLLLLVAGTLTQAGGTFDDADLFDVGKGDYKPERDLDLADFFDNDAPTEKPKVTQKPKTDVDDFGLNLEDVLRPDPKPNKPPVAPPKPGGGLASSDDEPVNPEPPKRGGFGLNEEDALNPGCQSNMIQKLGEVIKNQHQQIDMLTKVLAHFYKN